MTERGWLECGDPEPLIDFAVSRCRERSLLLFGVACCRRCWHLLSPQVTRDAVEAAERYADRGINYRQFQSALQAAYEVERRAEGNAATRAVIAAMNYRNSASLTIMSQTISEALGEESANPQHLLLIRDVTGSPFRAKADSPWARGRDETVRSLGHAAYRERSLPSGHLDPARLAVLSDALEEAGCDDANLLDHLRSPGPHVRGCWAVDLLTGRS